MLRAQVIVDEGINTVSYALDEQLIEALTLIQVRAWSPCCSASHLAPQTSAACGATHPAASSPSTRARSQFGAAMGEQNFERAVRVLEPLELTPETEAQWMELSELALSSNQVRALARGCCLQCEACRHRDAA